MSLEGENSKLKAYLKPIAAIWVGYLSWSQVVDCSWLFDKSFAYEDCHTLCTAFSRPVSPPALSSFLLCLDFLSCIWSASRHTSARWSSPSSWHGGSEFAHLSRYLASVSAGRHLYCSPPPPWLLFWPSFVLAWLGSTWARRRDPRLCLAFSLREISFRLFHPTPPSPRPQTGQFHLSVFRHWLSEALEHWCAFSVSCTPLQHV